MNDAVPYEGQGVPPVLDAGLLAGNEWHDVPPGVVPWVESRTPFRDLIIDLECRQGGWSVGWAWTACLPGIEQRASVVGATREGDTLTLDLAVDLAHHLPRILGATATYRLRLSVSGALLSGTCAGQVSEAFADLPADQRKKAQRSLAAEWGGKPGAEWPGRIRSQKLSTEASGRILLLPAPLILSARPRLLFTAAAMDTARAGAADAATVLAALRTQVADASSDPGAVAAGLAFLSQFDQDRSAADRAGAAALTAITRPGTGLALAKRLSAVAVAYDGCASSWPVETRNSVAAWLRAMTASLYSGRRVAGADPGEAPLGTVFRTTDPIFAAQRAAAGMAALALAGDPIPPGGTELDPSLASRSVRRFLEQGVGEHGAGPNHHGFAAALEMLLPFVSAWRNAGGGDLSRRTGLRWTPVLGMVSHGALLDAEQPRGAWLALGAPLLPAGFSGTARTRLAGWTPSDPFVAAAALVAWPRPAPPVDLPAAYEDRATCTYVFRSGADDAKDAVVTLEGAGLPNSGQDQAANLSLRAFGRDWIRRDRGVPGAGWPQRSRQNVVLVEAAAIHNQHPMEPTIGASLGRVQVGDRTASVSLHISQYLETIKSAPTEGPPDRGVGMRSLAVDWSGRSGAPVLVVVVDQLKKIGVREKCWQAEVGDIPADRVTTGDAWIELRPEGAAEAMRLTAVEPQTAWFSYLPPQRGKRGGLVRIWAKKPAKKQSEMVDDALKPSSAGDTDDLLDGPSARQQKVQRDAEVRASEAAAAGEADDSYAVDRAGTFVIAITIGSVTAPQVVTSGPGSFVPSKGRTMRPGVPFTIGKRRVEFDYYTIGFYDAP